MLASLGAWLGNLAGAQEGTGTSLVKATDNVRAGEPDPLGIDINDLFPGGQKANSETKQIETQPEQTQEQKQKPDTLQSVLSAINGLSAQPNATARRSAGAVASKMISQPTPIQFIQYMPPAKKRIAPISGRITKK